MVIVRELPLVHLTGDMYVSMQRLLLTRSLTTQPSGQERLNAERKKLAAKAAKEAEKRQKYLEEQRTVQNRDMPGERERIEYGLSKRSNDDIVKLVKGASKTVEGLEALTQIFPKELMPAKRTVVCGRCEKEYDPQVPGDNVCREEHPYEFVKTMWDGSKKSWSHCRRCDKDFGLDGFHSWGKRGRDDPEEEGDYCYETKHVPRDEYDPDEDSIMQGLDCSDY